ncbi:nickel pincer cofactor biosynthesis protein LarB [Ruania alba]|uniref:PurE domain-containing protein n=1 Tax=Ruania alba TaxID=648782 RepID=A0A1H5F127_9MICO|nr:hypothetical protein SAMN04488554_1196 [Ruania alba]
MTEPWHPPAEFARLDTDRFARRGYPEAVFCSGKTPEQVRAIATQIGASCDSDSPAPVLFTRATREHAQAVLEALPDAADHADAGMLAWPSEPPPAVGGAVLVLTAGTSDLPVAREAQLTATYLGRNASLISDVGVAGLHRIVGELDALRAADAIVVAAGMDGALPSVVAGLVEVPVVALPTSVGYGAAFGGSRRS